MAKKTSHKKATAAKKPVAKKAAPKPAKSAHKVAAKTPAKHAKEAPKLNKEQHLKTVLKKLGKGMGKKTPTIFKLPSRRNTPVAFSMSEMKDLLKEKSKKASDSALPFKASKSASVSVDEAAIEHKPRVLKSASLDDLLGLGSAKAKKNPLSDHSESEVPQKWLSYYKKLKNMRERLTLSVEERSEQTRASAKDSAGDLSSYGQHIGDAGTDAYDYDFALSMVSSEQEMLREVDAALNRIFDGTYGVCEVTGKPIARERLAAVPFTRFSKEGQDEYEKTRRKSAQRIGIASDDDDDALASGDEDNEQV